MKVAGRNGVVDVSTVLEAMHWISAYRQQYGIRVLNLSRGVASTQSLTVDPVNHAVQRLWSEGIVVVVAAGNSGSSAGTITKPGDDPVVLTVGAYNDQGDLEPNNDGIPQWSSRGPTAAGVVKPDLVARRDHVTKYCLRHRHGTGAACGRGSDTSRRAVQRSESRRTSPHGGRRTAAVGRERARRAAVMAADLSVGRTQGSRSAWPSRRLAAVLLGTPPMS